MSNLKDIDLSQLSVTQQVNLLQLLNEYDDRLRYNKLSCYFPDHGPYSRDKYPVQIQFMEAGKDCKERGLFGGNRSGKTFALNYEIALHLTGEYPDWWQGKRFNYPIKCWCASDTHVKIRDTAQYYLLGESWDMGTGMIPKENIDMKSIRSKANVPNAISTVRIKHYTNGVFDGFSSVDFMSYEQGRASFQGTSQDVISLDEEPPSDVYSECLTRTIQTDQLKESGIILFGFTPLSGLTATVLRFLPKGQFPKNNIIEGMSRGMWVVGWDKVPHIPLHEQKNLIASYLPHEIEARTKGLPTIGEGRVYRVEESDFVIPPFQIPTDWPRFYGFDIPYFSGYAAAVWIAVDPTTDVYYMYSEYKAKNLLPQVHAYAVSTRGRWVPGVIDPSAKRKNSEGIEFYKQYQDLGLDITLANNAVEAGIQLVQTMLSSNTLKVFSTCSLFLEEYRLYHLDKMGNIARDQDDHLLDATRYAIMSGISRASVNPEEERFAKEQAKLKQMRRSSTKNPITGY